jgi:hypothetical protein
LVGSPDQAVAPDHGKGHERRRSRRSLEDSLEGENMGPPEGKIFPQVGFQLDIIIIAAEESVVERGRRRCSLWGRTFFVGLSQKFAAGACFLSTEKAVHTLEI